MSGSLVTLVFTTSPMSCSVRFSTGPAVSITRCSRARFLRSSHQALNNGAAPPAGSTRMVALVLEYSRGCDIENALLKGLSAAASTSVSSRRVMSVIVELHLTDREVELALVPRCRQSFWIREAATCKAAENVVFLLLGLRRRMEHPASALQLNVCDLLRLKLPVSKRCLLSLLRLLCDRCLHNFCILDAARLRVVCQRHFT
mmetsp:Transcript_100404/g.199243  ORF Transcript_100404/g.199243 Transcript_100404/m.199243 type:complete len:202 (+) Transcript_100404:1023-1628(+)